MDEQHLIDEIRKGNRQAMHELYSLTVGRLVGVCQRYVTNQEDVKDIVQESYIQIFRNIDTFSLRHDGALQSWMTRIVANRSVSFLRHARMIEWTDIGVVADDVPDDEVDIGEVDAEVLHKCICSLPTGYRTVLNLHVFEQKSHKEIAQLLGIKESTSASQYLRAKAMLRKLITNHTS